MDTSFLKCGNVALIGLGTMMVCRAVTIYLNRGIIKSGLSINQMHTLFLVDRFRGENISSISKKGGMDRTTLTRSLSCRKMIDYVHIYRDPERDKRLAYPALTKKGADKLEEWMPTVLALEQSLEIPVADGESFIRLVNFFCSDVAELNKDNLPKYE